MTRNRQNYQLSRRAKEVQKRPSIVFESYLKSCLKRLSKTLGVSLRECPKLLNKSVKEIRPTKTHRR